MIDRARADRRLDGLPWRAAELGFQLVRTARRDLSRRRQPVRPGEPRHPTAAALAALGTRPDDDAAAAAWTASALRLTLAGHGYTEAAGHATWLLPRLDALAWPIRRQAVPAVIELLLATGARDRARQLAERHQAALGATAPGASLLGLLEVDEWAPRLVLPDGKLNALVLARLVERGELDADGLGRILLDHPHALLRDPQLHLLVASAALPRDRAGAAASLDRFGRVLRLPACRLGDATGHLLGELRFAPSTSSRRGPLVSVLVAAYRAAATLEFALDSLLAQSHRALEILVCDDASDDGTRARLLARYGREPRVRIFASTANQGSYNVRNRLLAEARGELVTFHDADDVALPTRIERQVRALERGGAVACLTTNLRVTAAGRFQFYKDQSAARLCMVSLMCRPQVIAGLGGFRPARFGADLDFYELLRAHHGDAAIEVIRKPLIWSDASTTSMIRTAGAEALLDGYRSPARRRYAELLFERTIGAIADDAIEPVLRELGNWAEPHSIVQLRR